MFKNHSISRHQKTITDLALFARGHFDGQRHEEDLPELLLQRRLLRLVFLFLFFFTFSLFL
jgi:hypothetical protein